MKRLQSVNSRCPRFDAGAVPLPARPEAPARVAPARALSARARENAWPLSAVEAIAERRTKAPWDQPLRGPAGTDGQTGKSNSDLPNQCQAPKSKIFRFQFLQIRIINLLVSSPRRGVGRRHCTSGWDAVDAAASRAPEVAGRDEPRERWTACRTSDASTPRSGLRQARQGLPRDQLRIHLR